MSQENTDKVFLTSLLRTLSREDAQNIFSSRAPERCSYFNRKVITMEDSLAYCKSVGITVWFAKMPRVAFIVRRGKRKLIVINKSLSRKKQRCALLHEIGHYLIHDQFLRTGCGLRHEMDQWYSEQIEREARIFALICMLPDHLLKSLEKKNLCTARILAKMAGVPLEDAELRKYVYFNYRDKYSNPTDRVNQPRNAQAIK